MPVFSTMISIFYCLILLMGGLLMISLSVVLLRTYHPNDVSMVWYFFSLSFVASFMVVWWANGHGAFTAVGAFTGQLGGTLNEILSHMLSLKESVVLFAGVAALIVLPQFMAYVLCAPFRCSAEPWFLGVAAGLVNLTVAKFFIVAAGMAASFLLGDMLFWGGNWARINMYLFLLVICIPFGFFIVFAHREVGRFASWLGETQIGQLLRQAHIWASKYRKPTMLDKVMAG